MIRTPTPSFPPVAKAQQATQPHAHPFVQGDEREAMTVLEVLKPASQGPVQVGEDGLQALPVVTPGLSSNRVLELAQALLARPTIAALEVVAEEVKAANLPGVHNPRLDRVQGQSHREGPIPHHFQPLLGGYLSPAKHYEVVGVPHHLDPFLGHEVVERVEIDVRQQRADHGTLGSSPFGRPALRRLHHLGGQKRLQQSQHLTVGYLLPHPVHQRRVRNRVEVAFQVRIHHPVVTLLQQGVDAAQRILAAPLRTEPVAVRREIPLEDRLQHRSERCLQHPVAHRRDAQGSHLFASQLGNPRPPDRLRTVTAVLQRLREFLQIRFQVALELFHRHVVHPCRIAVGLHSREGLPQVGQGVNLINQPKPLATLHPLFEGRQHSLRPNLRFHPAPPGSNRPGVLSFSCLLSPFRHCRRCVFPGLVRHVSTFLRSLRSRPITALLRYYGRSDSCPLRRGSARVSSRRPPVRLLRGQVSPIHALGLPTIPSPTTCGGSDLARARYPEAGRTETASHYGFFSQRELGASPLLCRLATSRRPNRVQFPPLLGSFLRTGRSPPAAAHPVSRRRSCSRLQVYVEPGEDFHLSSQVRSRAHSACSEAAAFPPVAEPNLLLRLLADLPAVSLCVCGEHGKAVVPPRGIQGADLGSARGTWRRCVVCLSGCWLGRVHEPRNLRTGRARSVRNSKT